MKSFTQMVKESLDHSFPIMFTSWKNYETGRVVDGQPEYVVPFDFTTDGKHYEYQVLFSPFYRPNRNETAYETTFYLESIEDTKTHELTRYGSLDINNSTRRMKFADQTIGRKIFATASSVIERFFHDVRPDKLQVDVMSSGDDDRSDLTKTLLSRMIREAGLSNDYELKILPRTGKTIPISIQRIPANEIV